MGDMMQQPDTGFMVGQCCGHVVMWNLVLCRCLLDCVSPMGSSKVGVAVPEWERGSLGLLDADTSEMVDAVALGARQGLLVLADAVAHIVKQLVLYRRRMAA